MKPVVRTFKKKRNNKRKGRKTRVCRKNRKLHRFYSILEKNRKNAYLFSKKYNGGAGGWPSIPNPFYPKETAEEEAKRVNAENIQNLQKMKKGEFNNPNPTTTPSNDITDINNPIIDNSDTSTDPEKVPPPPTNQQKLVAHKDLSSELDRKNKEEQLNKAMLYQNRYHVASSAMEASGKAAVAATVVKVAIGALAASGVGVPAAAGIAVCLILVSKLMKKYKEMQELNILLLDMNTILTNCYYLENMINKSLTVFQIYINDFTPEKKYYSKIITVDEYYTDLNNARSCKNIAILVEENTDKNETKPVEEKTPTVFIERTKALKGYNLGERIQNAKQLYIESQDIDAVINAEKAEYDAFGTAIDVSIGKNYINIDDEDAMESLLKFMVYKRIEEGFKTCKNAGEVLQGDVAQQGLKQNGGDKFYDAESKIIYKIGVNPDIKFRIKQKLDIIRDLLIEIDPSSAQDSMNSVELNESIDKIETKAFKILNKQEKNNLQKLITKSTSKSGFTYGYTLQLPYSYNKFLGKDKDGKNILNAHYIQNESELDTLLEKHTILDNDKLNNILNYWFSIKQKEFKENDDEMKKYLNKHTEEWTNFLKTCFLKMAFYKSGKKVEETDGSKPYANYEDWVRAFLRVETEKAKSSVLSYFSQKGTDVKKFLGAKNKTTLLMNTLNTLNALFIIINSQFEMSLKYYERALKFDYKDKPMNSSTFDDILDLIGYNSRSDKKNVKGIDRIWELCESSVSYQKFLLPPDFNEDKKAIMDQVDVTDFTKKSEGTPVYLDQGNNQE